MREEPVVRCFWASTAPRHDALIALLEADGVDCQRIAHLSGEALAPAGNAPRILLLDPDLMAQAAPHELVADFAGKGVVVALHDPGQESRFERIPADLVGADIAEPYDLRSLKRIVDSAFLYLGSKTETARVIGELDAYSHKLQEINRIGVALSTERDHDALLDLILRKCREVTSADAGSLYLAQDSGSKERMLRFKLSQNDSSDLSYDESTLALSRNSIAGYVALSGIGLNLADVYHLPQGAAYSFDRTWDQRTGYRTRSMLVVPMKNRNHETIGIVQLINRKKHPDAILSGPEATAREVVPFDSWSEELVTSLASQAAIALENSLLYRSIHDLFEGFVQASVTAIESRDPTTSGHSGRVAALTVGMAEVVDRIDCGRFKPISFTRDQLKEIRYASLLHDFGKVGVREEVLVKAKKLYPAHLDLITSRFAYVRKAIEADATARLLDCLLTKGREEYLECAPLIQSAMTDEYAALDRYLDIVLESNEPTVLEDGNFETLIEIAQRVYQDIGGNARNLLTPEEVGFLSIRRGSLDASERLEIESHVTHTYRFLSQIPWTSELKDVPEIAYAHHERLNGSGYPNQRNTKEIPIQSKIMTISDIYDALTASDRPYKKAVPLDKALAILGDEARSGNVDPDLLAIFIEAKVYDITREGASWDVPDRITVTN